MLDRCAHDMAWCAAHAGLQETYLATMDAIDRVRPGAALFILQGPQQQGPAGSSPVQWGNGFSVDQELLRLGALGGVTEVMLHMAAARVGDGLRPG